MKLPTLEDFPAKQRITAVQMLLETFHRQAQQLQTHYEQQKLGKAPKIYSFDFEVRNPLAEMNDLKPREI